MPEDQHESRPRDRLRTARIEEGRGPFKTYKSGSPDIAGKRMTRWLDDNMLAENGQPNYDLRRFLRDATQMPVEAMHRSEGEACGAMPRSSSTATVKRSKSARNPSAKIAD